MNANDRALDQFLFENRISPPPEFSARIDAFYGQLQRQTKANGTRINRSKRKKRKAQLLARRILIAAAFLWTREPNYSVLFANLSERDGGEIVKVFAVAPAGGDGQHKVGMAEAHQRQLAHV